MQKLTKSFLLAGAAFGLAACGDDVSVTPPTPAPASVVTGVTVSPATISIAKGQTVVATAQVTVSTGTGTPDKTVTWSSADANIASVGAATGAITGVAAGTTTIRATAGGVTGAATVTVTLGVQSVTIAPSSLSLSAGEKFTPVATVNRDNAAVAATVTWASSNQAVATIAASGEITAVAPGTSVITAVSTVDGTKSATMNLTVTALPTAVQSLTVAPTTATLAVNNTLQLVPNATYASTATGKTVSYTSSNGTVASVSASGLVTALQPGTAIITTKAKATVAVGAASRTDSLLVTTEVTVGARASVSIASLTKGNTSTPVNLAGVAGQIEASLNINSGAEKVEKVEVFINDSLAASQVFGVNGAPNAPVVLSINTASFNAAYEPTYTNGQKTIVAKIYPTGSANPTASNTVQFTLTNEDVVYFDATVGTTSGAFGLNHVGNSAQDGLGNTWWKGGFTFRAHPVVYSAAMDSIEYSSTQCGTAVGAAANYSASFDCASVETTQNVEQGITVYYPSTYTLTAAPTQMMVAASTGYVPGKPVWTAKTTREDNVGPQIAVGHVAYNDNFDEPWVNAAYGFAQDFTITDNGVGEDASTFVYKLYSTVCDGAAVTTGADLAETNASDATDGYRLCANAADLLGNTNEDGPTNYFGVDKVAPSVRVAGSTAATPAIAPQTVAANSVSSTANTTIYNIATPFTATDNWGLEGLDTRAGFNQNVVAGFPAVQSITVSEPTNTPTVCANFTGAMGTLLSDNYVRTPLEAFDCGYGAPGYFAYSGKIVDRAGNESAVVTRNWLIDQYAAPVLSAILPAAVNYTAGSPAAFNIYGTDDLEIIEADLAVTYPNLPVTVTWPLNALSGAARWDNTFSNVVTASSISVGNWLGRVDVTCTGAAAPYAGCAAADAKTAVAAEYNTQGTFTDNEMNPTGIAATAYDAGSNASNTVNQALSNLITNDVAQQWASADILTWKVLANTATDIVAEHKSSTSISSPYFSAVVLLRQDAVVGTTAIVCGVYPAAVRTDNGGFRYWTYTLTKPATGPCAAATGTWHALGIKNNAGLLTAGVP